MKSKKTTKRGSREEERELSVVNKRGHGGFHGSDEADRGG